MSSMNELEDKVNAKNGIELNINELKHDLQELHADIVGDIMDLGMIDYVSVNWRKLQRLFNGSKRKEK
jgi:hypothetical protein